MSVIKQSVRFLWLNLLLLISINTYANEIEVTVYSVTQSQKINLQQPLRLSQFLDQQGLAYADSVDNNINFSQAKLGNSKLQSELEQKRQDVLQQLTDLIAYYQKAGAIDYAVAARELRQQLQSAELFAAYYLSIKSDRLRLNLTQNVLLSALESPYQLFLPTGIVSTKRFGVSASNPAADKAYRWRIGLNGNIAREPVALYNSDEISRCYHHDFGRPLDLGRSTSCTVNKLKSSQLPGFNRYVGINPEVLPKQHKNLNERVVTLLKFVVDNYEN